MNKTLIIGIMGPGDSATPTDIRNAEKLGQLIAQKGWVTLTGARKCGVMEAALKGAKQAGGQTLGIIPSKNKADASEYADTVIVTGMNSGRNIINVLSSSIVIGCGLTAGTASEIALAVKEKKPVVLIADNQAGKDFFKSLAPDKIVIANTPEEVIANIDCILSKA